MSVTNSGALALVGSGEYTAAMHETDALLFTALGEAHRSVVLLPTASAREPGMPEEWNRRGVAHFTALDAPATPLLLLSRADAGDPALVDELRRHGFFYFSGGDPAYLVETLRDTPAWSVIAQAHAAGATVAGCSAGAMMLGEYVLSIRAMRQGDPPRWQPALGLARGVVVLPHFDRMRLFMGAATFDAALEAAPAGMTVLGIDEDTALVRLPADHAPAGVWRVTGRQTVTVFGAGRAAVVYQSGEHIAL